MKSVKIMVCFIRTKFPHYIHNHSDNILAMGLNSNYLNMILNVAHLIVKQDAILFLVVHHHQVQLTS